MTLRKYWHICISCSSVFKTELFYNYELEDLAEKSFCPFCGADFLKVKRWLEFTRGIHKMGGPELPKVPDPNFKYRLLKKVDNYDYVLEILQPKER